MTWKTRVRFGLHWKGRPDLGEVERRIAVAASRTWREGSKPVHGAVRKTNMWRIDSGIDDHEPLGRHVDALVVKLQPVREQIMALIAEYSIEAELALVLFYDPDSDPIPGVHLDRRSMSFFSEIGAELDIDIMHMEG